MTIDFLLTIQKVSALFMLIMLGFFAGKIQIISPKGQQDMTRLVIHITMPATIFSAMQLEMNPDRLKTSFVIFGILLCCYAFIFFFGQYISSKIPINKGQQDILQAALLLSNTSFMGYPIIQSLLGQEALFYAVVGAGFIFEVVAWSLGVYIISRSGSQIIGLNWRKIILSPGILSTVIGLVFFVFQLSVPNPLNNVIESLAPMTSPLAMIIIGVMLSRCDIKSVFSNKYLYTASILKLLIIPILILSTLKILGFSGPTLVIPVMMLSMPSATYVAMFSANFDNDAEFASQIIFMSSLLSMITIPIITLLF